jgi:pimeloyl-ACP methyl ester carboxylesterase
MSGDGPAGREALRAPLKHLAGATPPAPAWFQDALAQAPERERLEVAGAGIELLTWGERGRPGLLLLHGSAAHADWWSFLAPLLAQERRVAAISWSGMGGSDWRPRYSMNLWAEEALAAASHAGLFEADEKPVVVGHSMGGIPALLAAAQWGERLRFAAALDTPLRPPEAKTRPPREQRFHNVYPTLEAALARFRFAPEQACEHLFIADLLARRSLIEAPGGWTWRFDPFVWRHFDRRDLEPELRAPQCPVVMLYGERSGLIDAPLLQYMRDLLPPGAPFIAIPDADHHVMVDQPLAVAAALRALLAP